VSVSGKTTKLEWPYFLGGDKPPDMAAVTKAQAERAEAIFVGTAGQVLIDQSTGVPAPKTLKGDATLAEDGTLTVGAGKVLESKLADAAVTSRKFKPTILSKVSNAEKTYNSSLEEVPGTSLTFTLPTESILWISMSALYRGAYVSTDQCCFRAFMFLDGVQKNPGVDFCALMASGQTLTIEELLQQTLPLTVAAGEHTLLMKGHVTNNVGSSYKTLVTEGGTSGIAGATGWNALVLSA